MWRNGRRHWGYPRDARTLSRFQGNTPPLPEEDKDEKHSEQEQTQQKKRKKERQHWEKKYFLHPEFWIPLLIYALRFTRAVQECAILY